MSLAVASTYAAFVGNLLPIHPHFGENFFFERPLYSYSLACLITILESYGNNL
jgi:hypothetical protein